MTGIHPEDRAQRINHEDFFSAAYAQELRNCNLRLTAWTGSDHAGYQPLPVRETGRARAERYSHRNREAEGQGVTSDVTPEQTAEERVEGTAPNAAARGGHEVENEKGGGDVGRRVDELVAGHVCRCA